MRSQSSLPPAYFEAMFRGDADPWRFETSCYETTKYDATLAALDGRFYHSALEVGCANGVLTKRVAAQCRSLLAIDVSETALGLARDRCAASRHVDFALMPFPNECPAGTFDLILMSEVVYYWSRQDIGRAAAFAAHHLVPGGDLLMVHWIGETDYPHSGDDAVGSLRRDLPSFIEIRAARTEKYRLDLWRRP